MSTITEADIVERIAKLPDIAKREVLDFIDERIQNEKTKTEKVRPFGWGKHLVISYTDDDEHMADFREYME
jgi:hypothetical protein